MANPPEKSSKNTKPVMESRPDKSKYKFISIAKDQKPQVVFKEF